MVATSLPVTSFRRTALTLTALVVVAQLMASSSVGLSVNQFKSGQRLQQLIHNGDGELSTCVSHSHVVRPGTLRRFIVIPTVTEVIYLYDQLINLC